MTAPMFATLADLYVHGAPTRCFGALTDEQRTAGIGAASAEAYGYFRSRGQGTLVSWDTTVTKMVCQIAAYDLMCTVGFNPSQGADQNYVMRATNARLWLRQVGKGEVTPDLVFAVDKALASMPQVISRPPIGW